MRRADGQPEMMEEKVKRTSGDDYGPSITLLQVDGVNVSSGVMTATNPIAVRMQVTLAGVMGLWITLVFQHDQGPPQIRQAMATLSGTFDFEFSGINVTPQGDEASLLTAHLTNGLGVDACTPHGPFRVRITQ
jgi:hypothetical protein